MSRSYSSRVFRAVIASPWLLIFSDASLDNEVSETDTSKFERIGFIRNSTSPGFALTQCLRVTCLKASQSDAGGPLRSDRWPDEYWPRYLAKEKNGK